jgi:hypothetical protein
MNMTEKNSYQGNPNLKQIGYQHEFTIEEIQEIVKCQQDPIYFIENYCHIVTLDHGLQLFKLYDCQKTKVKIILENRKVVLMEGRQAGKCSEKSTIINIRRKSDGRAFDIKIGDFYAWQRFCAAATSNQPEEIQAVVRILQARTATTEEKGRH